MLIRCPTCAFAFELAEESMGVKATTSCPSCARVIVARDAHVVSPRGDATVPLEAWTEVAQGPPGADEATASARLKLPPGKRLALAIVEGPGRGNWYRIDRPRVVVGRQGGGASIEVEDVEVSRTHAALECHGPRIVLRDLDSRNGTWLGGRKVAQGELQDGSEFRLGRTRFMLIVSNA